MTIGKADLSKADIGVIAALLVGVLSAASLAFIKLRPSAAFVYALAAFVGAVLIAYSYHFFLRLHLTAAYALTHRNLFICHILLSSINSPRNTLYSPDSLPHCTRHLPHSIRHLRTRSHNQRSLRLLLPVSHS